ncbi:MAG: FtsX-like permease family protein, partial [Acidobacteriaceae bacterium]|nr:FtsX-like permease family protein [Acidobacteriaceae bacterium]
DRGVRIAPLAAQIHGKTIPFLLATLSGAVFLVLLIACANAANLLLARGAARANEIALRTALGASRPRIVRQLVTESMLLSVLAGVLSLPCAVWVLQGLLLLAPHGIARLDDASIDSRVLAFSLGLSVFTGLLFGLAPAFGVSREVRDSRQTARVQSQAMRRAFVITEVALAVVLLTGAGLFIRSFVAAESVDPGIRTERVIAATLRFPNQLPRVRRVALYRDALQRLGELPGVSAAGAVSTMFYNIETGNFGLRAVEGRSETRAQWRPLTWSTVQGDYFQALSLPLLRGRFFNNRDTRDSTPVVIINETMARRYWPGEDPIGKGIKGFDPRGHNDEWVRVVGVIKDMRSGGIERSPISQIYEPQSQSLDETEDLVVRTDLSAGALRKAIQSVNPEAVLLGVTTLHQRLREQTASRRFQTFLLGSFALLAVALAAAGIFAMMHYSVAQRTREIGIRIAVGARPLNVLKLVVGEAFVLVASGLTIGLMLALVLTRALRSMLFEVSPADPLTIVSVIVLLAGLGLLSSYLPALRATRVDPTLALRCE